MELLVDRFEISLNGLGLIGRMSVNGVEECFSMENKELAIPAGIYSVEIDQSPLFTEKETQAAGRPIQAYSPHILNVPGRSGIRIHSGSTHADEIGCIAVGQVHPDHQDFIGSSRLAVAALLPKIEKALGLSRVPGPPECRIHGEAGLSTLASSTDVWHYEKTSEAEEVTIEVKDDFLIQSTTSAG